MSTIVKGRLGYNLVEKRLLEHEFDIYTPILENFFIGVDLENNVTYVVPIDLVEQYTSNISISTLENYKEKYSLMEP